MAMICIHRERLYSALNKERVVIQADETPATFPTTGDGVEGLPAGVTIAPASILYTLDQSEKYLMDSESKWKKWEG